MPTGLYPIAMTDCDRPHIRPIRPDDDAAVATLIRQVMTEFGAVGRGFSIEDPEVDAMFRAYDRSGAAFWIVEGGGAIRGAGGYAPLDGGDPETCELRKMYFLPELRGLGLGAELLRLCLTGARQDGYRRCYLETLASMAAAQRLYRSFGFREIDAPLGATGHCGCDRWMVLDLDA